MKIPKEKLIEIDTLLLGDPFVLEDIIYQVYSKKAARLIYEGLEAQVEALLEEGEFNSVEEVITYLKSFGLN